MKTTTAKQKFLYIMIAAAFALALFMAGGLAARTAYAADPVYYICYESDDYRVRAANKMDASGGVYTISPTLSRGAKFIVSDGAGGMYGNDRGEPIAVTELGTHRYTVTFDPAATGGKVSYAPYSPEAMSVAVYDGSTESAAYPMEYRRANTAFDEYVITVSGIAAGQSICIKAEDGTYYGMETKGAAADEVDAYVAPLDGEYRFTFTKDDDNLYDGKKYITAEDVPALYVLCEANGYRVDDTDPDFAAKYGMTRNEDVTGWAEYEFSFLKVSEKDGELRYSVYDADAKEEYKPDAEGKLQHLDKGRYRILYSPDHPYRTDGDVTYRTTARRMDEFYDGYYVLGDFNDYEYINDDGFDRLYKLVKDESVTDYDEYKLTLYVTSEMLDEYDGSAEFYVTDGAAIYRKPTGSDIRIDRAGEYELYFSPTHNYGRGYSYRYERVADELQRETVYIGSEEEFAQFAAQCVSPEFTLNKDVMIKRDLDFTDKTFTPMAVFAGTLDGLFNTIKGIRIDNDDNPAYIIRTLDGDGKITRIAFNAELKGGDYVAPVCYARGDMDDVKVSGVMEGKSYVGGVAAACYAGSEIKDCESRATVNGILNVGGIAGFNAGEIVDCTNSGDINVKIFDSADARSMLNVGGIAGYATGNIFGCTNTGSVGVDQARYFGGIVGLSSGGIYFCSSSGSVGAEQYAGGIAGYYGRFNSNNGDNPLAGYLVGTQFEGWLDDYFGTGDGNFEEAEDTGVREIYYCDNSGAVTAENRAGGIAGHAGAEGLDIVGCVSTGNVTAKTSYAGGIAGELGSASVRECVAYGDIISDKGSYAGGIAGSSSGVIEYCASAAYVEAEADYAGGISGDGGTVRNCVSHAFVHPGTGSHFGVIAGAASVIANNFYPINTANDVKGVDGADYGQERNYGACALEEAQIMSVGMLSAELYGLSAEHWLAGAEEASYPVPRAFTDIVEPDQYTQVARFRAAFDGADGIKYAAAEVGASSVVVTFYKWDFDAKKFERLDTYYILRGEGITPPAVPAEDGYFTWWEEDDFSAFYENKVIYMAYDKYVTALGSDASEKPLVIVTGKFYSDSKLALDQRGEYLGLSFTRGEDGTPVDYAGKLTVRYRVEGNDITVRIISGGEMKDAASRVDGGYVIFELPAGAEFVIIDNDALPSNTLPVILAIVLTAFAVAAAFSIVLVILRIKKNKKA